MKPVSKLSTTSLDWKIGSRYKIRSRSVAELLRFHVGSVLFVGKLIAVDWPMERVPAANARLGSNLSSGQRQLVSLARALLCPTNIMVLDEATVSGPLFSKCIYQIAAHIQPHPLQLFRFLC
jgi:ABC-type glutathione transport system ATPase component